MNRIQGFRACFGWSVLDSVCPCLIRFSRVLTRAYWADRRTYLHIHLCGFAPRLETQLVLFWEPLSKNVGQRPSAVLGVVQAGRGGGWQKLDSNRK